MRIIINDYAGHTFQPQLSRELARRGHTVVHSFRVDGHGRHGAMTKRPDDPQSLSFAPIGIMGRGATPSGFVGRFVHERAYAHEVARLVRSTNADVVLSGTTPLLSQRLLLRDSHRAGAGFVYWLQDLVSAHQGRRVNRRLGVFGGLFGGSLRWLERSSLRGSEHVVSMMPGFEDVLASYGVPSERVTVIPNWGAVDEIKPMPRSNPWAVAQGLVDKVVFIYAGSLGIKHYPELLAKLASALPDAEVVVISDGPGAQIVQDEATRLAAKNVRVLPNQPWDELANVLGSADVLMANLDPEGARYSMPSKVLTYLCAGRAILAMVPHDNIGATTVRNAQAGCVVEPGQDDAFIAAARELAANAAERDQMGTKGREYAVLNFDIGPIADKFEGVLKGAVTGRK